MGFAPLNPSYGYWWIGLRRMDLRQSHARPRNGSRLPSLVRMERIYLMIMCAGIVLLTTAFGLASPRLDAVHSPDKVPLLLRIVPR